MLKHKFYWGHIRKAITAFGVLFNGIQIDRKDENEEVSQTLRIPLMYGPRQKFIAKIQANPQSYEQDFQVNLPRMSFEIMNIYYDASRKISPVQSTRTIDTVENKIYAQYAPTPYNLDVRLSIYSKNQDDALQIVEQILPFFNPDYNLNLKALAELDFENDMQIVLNEVSFDDNYEGPLNEARMIIWSLSFTMKINLFGPLNKQGVIKRAIVNFYTDAELKTKIERYTAEVNPFDANKTDDYTIDEMFEYF